MYQTYWNFTQKPFKNTPDPNLFYFSNSHEEALTRMFYTLLERRGSMLLTGDCGCGKTLVSRLFYKELRQKRDRYKLILIDNPNLSHQELLKEIVYQLGYPIETMDKIQLLQIIKNHLNESKQQNRETVIIVDEAQHIQSKATLEELRLLLNHHHDNDFLLTLYLIGQPEFNDIVQRFPQLDQRISMRFHLTPFDLQETKNYIQQQLKLAGSTQTIFQPDAIEAIYQISKGIPRIINHICDNALLRSYSLKKDKIDKETIIKINKNEHIIM